MHAIFTQGRSVLPSLNLKTKMALVVSCLLLGTVSAVTFFSATQFEQTTKTIISTQQFALVSSLADNIDDKLRFALEALVANSRHIPQAALQGDAEVARRFLDSRHGLHSLFEDLSLLSEAGKQIAETPNLYIYENLDFSYRPYFKNALATKSPQVSEPFLAVPTDQPTIMLTVPILNQQGQVVAVLAGSLHLLEDNFLAELARQEIGQAGYLSLFNRSGTFIIHPDQERILTQDISPAASPGFDQATAGFEGTIEAFSSRGQPSLTSFKSLTAVDWILGVSFPLDAAYAAVDATRQYVLLSLIPLIVLALLVTWWIMSYLLAPLRLLTRHVAELPGKALPDRPFAGYRNDEIGSLAQTFNALMGKLSKEQAMLVEAKALAEEERAKTEAVIAAIGDALTIKDTDFKILYQNRIAEDLLGERVGKTCHKALFKRAQPCSECALVQTFRDGQTHVMEKKLMLGEKSALVEFTTSPIRDTDGTIVAGVEILRDISVRKATEERIRKLSRAVEQSPVEIVITDTEGRIEYVNPRFSENTGYAAEEVLGQYTSTLQSDDVARPQEQAAWQAVLAGGGWRGELQHRRKDGGLYWLQASLAPIRDDAGITTHFLSTGQDITEHKLLEGQMRHAQKMEAVGQLAAGVAHDFNNILTVIIGYVGLLKLKAQKGSKLLADLELIDTAAGMGARLVQELLSFSRKKVTHPEQLDLNALVKQALNLLRQLVGPQLKIHASLNPAALSVMVDSLSLEQVLMNLATNARDAMAEGGQLTITSEQVSLGHEFTAHNGFGLPGDYALLSLSDNGRGMAAETVQKIFEPFFTTKEVGKGTGLGLAISYSIIKQHQGYIICRSEPGQGTTFQIYLPLRAEPAVQTVESENPGLQGRHLSASAIEIKEVITSEPF